LADVQKADVALAALDTTDIAAVQVATKRQLLLREALLAPELAYPAPKLQ